MTYDQFWKEDPWLARYYRAAYIERRKEENRRDWLQGAYFYNALAIALSNAFSKKGTKQKDYIEEPFPIFPPTADEAEAKLERERQQAEAQMQAFAAKQRAMQAQRKQNNAEAGKP